MIGPVHEKFLAGASLEECQKSLANDYNPEEAVKIISTWAYVDLLRTPLRKQLTINSGTGVGLVTRAQPAGEIVREVRGEAIEAIKRLAGLV